MAVSSDTHRKTVPLAPVVGTVVGACAVGIVALLPLGGIASLPTIVAMPPGLTARMLAALVVGGGVGVIGWIVTLLAVGDRAVAIGARNFRLDHVNAVDDSAPVLRRGDAHPDAPSRRLIRAGRDLGTPLLEINTAPRHLDASHVADFVPTPAGISSISPCEERALPVDLDQPLAAYATMSLGTPDAPTLTQEEQRGPFPLKRLRPDPAEAIHALLDRFEPTVQRSSDMRTKSPPSGRVEDMLESLRAMARRAH
jgi:hypothetical protein